MRKTEFSYAQIIFANALIFVSILLFPNIALATDVIDDQSSIVQVVGQLNAEFPDGLNAAASNEFQSFNLIDLNTTDPTAQHEILALMTATSTQFPEIQISESSVISVISDLPKTWPLLEYPNIKYQLLFQPLLQTISTGHVRYSEQCPNSNISSYGNLIIDVRQTPRANSNGSQIAF